MGQESIPWGRKAFHGAGKLKLKGEGKETR